MPENRQLDDTVILLNRQYCAYDVLLLDQNHMCCSCLTCRVDIDQLSESFIRFNYLSLGILDD